MIDYSEGKDKNFITYYEVKDGNIILYGKEERIIPYTKENEKFVLEQMKVQIKSWQSKANEHRIDCIITKKILKFKFVFLGSVSGVFILLRNTAFLPFAVGCISLFPLYHHFTKDIKAYIKDYDKNLFFVENEEDINKVLSEYASHYNLVNGPVLCLTINDMDSFTQEELENILKGNIDDDLTLRLKNVKNYLN